MENRDEICILMEYCSGGNLADAAKLMMADTEVRSFTKQVLLGLRYLHDHNIVHHDIKGENVLLTEDGVCKIGDFNTARRLKTMMTATEDMPEGLIGTPSFMAPEIINKEFGKVGRPSDVWSVGCCVIQMMTGKAPFSNLNHSYAIIYKLGQGKHPKIPENQSSDSEDFLRKCFMSSAEERATASSLLFHQYLAGAVLPEQSLNSQLNYPPNANPSTSIPAKKTSQSSPAKSISDNQLLQQQQLSSHQNIPATAPIVDNTAPRLSKQHESHRALTKTSSSSSPRNHRKNFTKFSSPVKSNQN